LKFVNLRDEFRKKLTDPHYVLAYLQGAAEENEHEFYRALTDVAEVWLTEERHLAARVYVSRAQRAQAQNEGGEDSLSLTKVKVRLYQDLLDPDFTELYLKFAKEEGPEALRLAEQDIEIAYKQYNDTSVNRSDDNKVEE
jgi:hypothetical protein